MSAGSAAASFGAAAPRAVVPRPTALTTVGATGGGGAGRVSPMRGRGGAGRPSPPVAGPAGVGRALPEPGPATGAAGSEGSTPGSTTAPCSSWPGAGFETLAPGARRRLRLREAALPPPPLRGGPSPPALAFSRLSDAASVPPTTPSGAACERPGSGFWFWCSAGEGPKDSAAGSAALDSDMGKVPSSVSHGTRSPTGAATAAWASRGSNFEPSRSIH